jgi:hypothetical protein
MHVKQMIRNSVFVAASALAGCSSMNGMLHGTPNTADLAFRSSSEIQAGQGRLAVKKADGANEVVAVTVERMAPAPRVKAGATTYVVWLLPDGASYPTNVGVLAINKDMKGSLEFKTPFQKFEVFVTAEPSALSQVPSDHHRLLTAAIDLPGHAVR